MYERYIDVLATLGPECNFAHNPAGDPSMLVLTPASTGTDGFFVAVLQRTG